MKWGSKTDGVSINIRLSKKTYEQISARATATRHSFQEVLRDAIEVSLRVWEKGEDIIAERDSLRAKNEFLHGRLRTLQEKKAASSPAKPSQSEHPHPEKSPGESAPEKAPGIKKEPPLRRIPEEEQERVLRKAQRRLESLRQQQRRWTKDLQFSPPKEQKKALEKLKNLETSIPIITVALAKGHKSLYDKRQERSELLSHGRARGVALEESERAISRGPVSLDPQELLHLEEEEWFGDPW